jgi:hypothetical protein
MAPLDRSSIADSNLRSKEAASCRHVVSCNTALLAFIKKMTTQRTLQSVSTTTLNKTAVLAVVQIGDSTALVSSAHLNRLRKEDQGLIYVGQASKKIF